MRTRPLRSAAGVVHSRAVIPAVMVMCVVALSGMAKEPRWPQAPRTPVTLESSGFEIRTTLPQGWSYTTPEGFIPPADRASTCRVRLVIHTNREWDAVLVPALRATEGAQTNKDARFVMKAGGHPAVSNSYIRAPRMVRDIYINLSALQRDSAAVWTFEGSRTAEGSDCELQFLSIVQSAKIQKIADEN